VATGSVDLARFYPSLDTVRVGELSSPDIRAKFLSLVPFVELKTEVQDLAYVARDGSGSTTVLQGVQRRPWEWIEYPGEQGPGNDSTAGSANRQLSITNTGSLSLELFDARNTGESVHNWTSNGKMPPSWAFEDGLKSDSLYLRSCRDTYLDAVEVPESRGNSDLPMLPAISGITGLLSHPGSRAGSPASSIHSFHPASVPGSATSTRFSPAQLPFGRGSAPPFASTSTPTNNALPTLNNTARRMSKRKAPEEEDSDEVQIIDPPSPSKAAPKKGKGKAEAKSKGQKR
jgi:hypothetical protein